jgi:signal transduction histidine kinase
MAERQLDRGDQEAIRSNVQSIRSAARRMQRLVDDLLVAARLGEGRFEIHPMPIDLAACVRQIAVEQQAYTRDHQIHVEAPDSLPGLWDGERLAQALTNLISNAIKYSPDGGDIKIRLRAGDGLVQLAVADHGWGIRPDQVPYLFEPFSRLDGPAAVDGNGLGLYITKGIVESHGGNIWVESRLGEGSTFRVTLPWQMAETDRLAQAFASGERSN